ncbi:MAG: hypothetical protein JOZ08_14180 [Verrucomicrobia bacterium]|nr:hypothetical protein [Verrucomicrobiota bacterium]
MTKMIYLGIVILAVLGLASSKAFGQTNGSLSSTAGIVPSGVDSSLVGNALGFVVHLAGKDIIYLWEGGVFPVATRTNDHDIVVSPYAPHNRVTVYGIRSGELVMDPSVMKPFVRP